MEFTDSWAKPLEEEFKHLFDQSENGKILRGIEVGKGWERHVVKLLESFEWLRTHNVTIDNPDFDPKRQAEVGWEPTNKASIPKPEGENVIKIFQIKEKFGDARVYWSCDNPRITNMIEAAVGRFEGKCEITCERCGKLQYDCIRNAKSGWIVCICDECFEGKANGTI